MVGMAKQQSRAVDRCLSAMFEPSPETTSARPVQFFADCDISLHIESANVCRSWFTMKAAMLEIEGWSNITVEGNMM